MKEYYNVYYNLFYKKWANILKLKKPLLCWKITHNFLVTPLIFAMGYNSPLKFSLIWCMLDILWESGFHLEPSLCHKYDKLVYPTTFLVLSNNRFHYEVHKSILILAMLINNLSFFCKRYWDLFYELSLLYISFNHPTRKSSL